MASKLKDRRKKKRKYTRRNNGDNFNLKTNQTDGLDKQPTTTSSSTMGNAYQETESVSVNRASDTSYVFVHGNRVPIRNLSDEYLNEEFDRLSNENRELRRQLQHGEHLEFEMTREQLFRGLK